MKPNIDSDRVLLFAVILVVLLLTAAFQYRITFGPDGVIFEPGFRTHFAAPVAPNSASGNKVCPTGTVC